ncbi:hypothetical protein lerEdw1_001839 [Lerista edwardsae]|nr:hypothetical protein lerEdw1_001839 [Lerista edwardsae]
MQVSKTRKKTSSLFPAEDKASTVRIATQQDQRARNEVALLRWKYITKKFLSSLPDLKRYVGHTILGAAFFRMGCVPKCNFTGKPDSTAVATSGPPLGMFDNLLLSWFSNRNMELAGPELAALPCIKLSRHGAAPEAGNLLPASPPSFGPKLSPCESKSESRIFSASQAGQAWRSLE